MNDEKKVDILGTEYTIKHVEKSEDDFLKDCDGYCDETSKSIVIAKKWPEFDGGNFEVYKKSITRHEIIHAYLFESGLAYNFGHPNRGHDETYVDWIARQFPKLLETFKEVGCI